MYKLSFFILIVCFFAILWLTLSESEPIRCDTDRFLGKCDKSDDSTPESKISKSSEWVWLLIGVLLGLLLLPVSILARGFYTEFLGFDEKKVGRCFKAIFKCRKSSQVSPPKKIKPKVVSISLKFQQPVEFDSEDLLIELNDGRIPYEQDVLEGSVLIENQANLQENTNSKKNPEEFKMLNEEYKFDKIKIT